MAKTKFLRKACFAGIGAIEFSREKLSDLRETISDSLDDFVQRGERLNDTEDSLVRALLAALDMEVRVPSSSEVNIIIPGYDDLPAAEIIAQIKSVPMKKLAVVRNYEYHTFNRIRILRQIDKELDEIRIIPDYDSLPVGAVVEELDNLTARELAGLKDYERTHRNRTTIIKAIDRRLKKSAAA